MKHLLITILCILMGILGAITHERDMYNNLLETGDAHAWTVKITSNEMKVGK